jgi:peptide-methionine (R)-S-oxide reductase
MNSQTRDPAGAAMRYGVLILVLTALLVAGGLWIGGKREAVAPAQNTREEQIAMAPEPANKDPVLPKSDAEWKKLLTPEQYRVTREKGTEAPFSGKYYKIDKQGVYRCVCCGAALFSSETKFDAHCGWPSFWKPLAEGNLKLLTDDSHGMRRIEVQCRHCGAHLGHVFDDGPQPTGQRFCINSASLDLHEKKAP